MVKVFAYEDGKVGCRCGDCKQTFTEDISKRLSNNCALDIDVICKDCGDTGVLYFTRCTDEYMAKELMAKISRAKENRKGIN